MPKLALTAAACAALLLGCQSAATGPIAASPDLGPQSLAGGGETIAGMFAITVDPQTLTASVIALDPRSAQAQPPQAMSYDIDITQFSKADTFAVTAVRFDTVGDIRLDFSHAHPFPAPDFTKPITAANRTDLGYTGRVLILTDGPTTSFFGGSAVLDGTFVKSANGYLNPGDLLANPPAGSANTFPYMLLTDEARNNRSGVSNGGVMTGNYSPSGHGWQQANIGASNNAWTGYDYIHGGQRINNRILLRRARLTGPTTFNVALLIKWTDPRGAGGKLLRFPPTPADPLQFAYRLPFSALDASVVAAGAAPEIGETNGSITTATALVRDWDAQAVEAADADLSNETNVTLIPPGTAGAPTLDLEVPGVGNTTLIASSGSGLPGAELAYSGTLTNTIATAPRGFVTGLLRAIDPELDNPAEGDYRFGVDPTTLIPNFNRALDLTTYQLATIEVVEVVAPPDEILMVSAAYGVGHALEGQSQLVQILPSLVPVPNTLGTTTGASNGDILPSNPFRGIFFETAGNAFGIDLPSGANKDALGIFTGIHPSFATTAPAALAGQTPFVFIRSDVDPIAMWIANFADASLYSVLPFQPRPFPGLTIEGETSYGDMAAPDWSPADNTKIVCALGDGIEVLTGFPFLEANGDLYIYTVVEPLGGPVKLTNLPTNGSQGVFFPDWHPDGSKIVCTHINRGDFTAPFKLATADASTGALTSISLSGMGTPPSPATSYIPITPAYNKDGTKLAFAALEASLADGAVYDADVWVLDIAGGGTFTNVTDTDDVLEAYPVFR